MARNTLDIIAQYAEDRYGKGRKSKTFGKTLQVFVLGGEKPGALGPNERYMGAGPDGVVQPDKPVKMVNTMQGPRLIHEGEIERENPDGSVSVTPAEQARLEMLQKKGMQGYAIGTPGYWPTRTGGSTTGGTSTPFNVNDYSATAEANKMGEMEKAQPKTLDSKYVDYTVNNLKRGLATTLSGNRPAPTPVGTGASAVGPVPVTPSGYNPATDSRLFSADPASLSPADSARLKWLKDNGYGPISNTMTDEQILAADPNSLSPENTARLASLKAAMAPPGDISAVAGPATAGKNAAPDTTGGTTAMGAELGANAAAGTSAAGTGAGAGAGTQTTAGAGNAAITEGTSNIRDIARGESALDDEIRKYYLGAWNMQGAASDAQMYQQLAASGKTPEEIAAIMQSRGRDRDVARAGMFSQMGISEAERAQQASGQLAQLGFKQNAETRAQTQFETEQRNAVETDASGYLSNMSFTDGYNWRNDPVARQKLQAAWEANGGQGTFDENWADNFYKTASTSPSDAFITQAHQAQWYLSAPDETTYNDDGTIAVWGKDMLDQGIMEMSRTMSLGGLHMAYDPKTGRVYLADSAGTPVDGNDPANVTPVWVPDDPTNHEVFSQDWFDDNSVIGGSTVGFENWMETHNNQVPPDADTWEDWSWEDRVFDPTDEDDLDAAYDTITMNDKIVNSGVPYDPATVSLYLSTHGNTFGGDEQAFIEWARRIGSPEAIADFMAGNIETLEPKDRTMLTKAVSASALFNKQYDTPEDRAKAFTDAGFANEAEAQWYVDNVLGGKAPASYNSTDIEVPEHYHNIDPDTPFVNYPHSTFVQLDPPEDVTQWAQDNAGKPITVNGHTYILAQEADLLHYGRLSGGGDMDDPAEWDRSSTWVRGYKAYDPVADKWVVISPHAIDPTRTDTGYAGHHATVNNVYVTSNWTAYELSTDPQGEVIWTPGEFGSAEVQT